MKHSIRVIGFTGALLLATHGEAIAQTDETCQCMQVLNYNDETLQGSGAIAADGNNEGPPSRTLCYKSIGSVTVGQTLICMADFEVSNELEEDPSTMNYKLVIGSTTDANGTGDLDITLGAGIRITHQMHHIPIACVGAYIIPGGMSGSKYVKLVGWSNNGIVPESSHLRLSIVRLNPQGFSDNGDNCPCWKFETTEAAIPSVFMGITAAVRASAGPLTLAPGDVLLAFAQYESEYDGTNQYTVLTSQLILTDDDESTSGIDISGNGSVQITDEMLKTVPFKSGSYTVNGLEEGDYYINLVASATDGLDIAANTGKLTVIHFSPCPALYSTADPPVCSCVLISEVHSDLAEDITIPVDTNTPATDKITVAHVELDSVVAGEIILAMASFETKDTTSTERPRFTAQIFLNNSTPYYTGSSISANTSGNPDELSGAVSDANGQKRAVMGKCGSITAGSVSNPVYANLVFWSNPQDTYKVIGGSGRLSVIRFTPLVIEEESR